MPSTKRSISRPRPIGAGAGAGMVSENVLSTFSNLGCHRETATLCIVRRARKMRRGRNFPAQLVRGQSGAQAGQGRAPAALGQMTRRSFCNDVATAFDTSVMNCAADEGLKVLLVPDQISLFLPRS